MKKPIRGKRNPTDKFHAKKDTPKRSKRNQARRVMLKKLTGKYGSSKAKSMMKGKDVGHKTPLSEGGTNAPSNLVLQSAKINRGSDKARGPYRRRKGKIK